MQRGLQSKPINRRLNASHYSIIIKERQNGAVFRRMWTRNWCGTKITDPAEARTRRFFIICQQTTKLAGVGGMATFAISPHWENDIIVPGLPYESSFDYLENVWIFFY